MKTFENISLKNLNTFGIEAKARRMLVVEPGDAVPKVEGPLLVLGAGSDVVFTHDYEGTVMRLADVADVLVDGTCVSAWGGMAMDDLVQWTIDRGLYGLENLSAIPGTVGASVVQNVGAYGVEAKDVVERVEAYDLQQGCMVCLSPAECAFGYRTSRFKQEPGRWLVLRVVYRLDRIFEANLSYKALERLPHASADELRRAIIDLRWSKLPKPDEHGSAGSFFKNPVVAEKDYLSLREQYPDMPEAHPTDEGYKLSAGWLIDRARWKGRIMGKAGVWPNNALVLYNAGGCTGDEVVALARAIRDDVLSRFGVALECEAIII